MLRDFLLVCTPLLRKSCEKMENYAMSTNGMTTATRVSTSEVPRRRNIYVSSLVIRVFIALVISWLIVMAFFITNAASH